MAPQATDYLPASYVKWIELGGARVVPVMHEATDREVDAIFANTNGLLLIGGGAPVCSAARRFFANAVSAARAGDAYPIWANPNPNPDPNPNPNPNPNPDPKQATPIPSGGPASASSG